MLHVSEFFMHVLKMTRVLPCSIFTIAELRLLCLLFDSITALVSRNCLLSAARRCGHPGEIRNGYMSDTAFVYPNRVTYACYDGYELTGRRYRVCQADGQWSGELPQCRRKSLISMRWCLHVRNGQIHLRRLLTYIRTSPSTDGPYF